VLISRTGPLTLKKQTAAFPVSAGMAVGHKFPNAEINSNTNLKRDQLLLTFIVTF
jgi:hypothetical protein